MIQASDNRNPTHASESGCTVSNAVKEAYYRVLYSATKNGLEVVSIRVDFLVQNDVKFDSSCCTPGEETPAKCQFQQNFGIEFVPVNSKVSEATGTTLSAIADKGVVFKSGDFGY